MSAIVMKAVPTISTLMARIKYNLAFSGPIDPALIVRVNEAKVALSMLIKVCARRLLH